MLVGISCLACAAAKACARASRALMFMALDGSLLPRVVDAKIAISVQPSRVQPLHGQGQLLTLVFRRPRIDHRRYLRWSWRRGYRNRRAGGIVRVLGQTSTGDGLPKAADRLAEA